MKKNLYWGSIEYKYGKGHTDYKMLKGGFVYVFFYAKDVRHFIEVVKDEFKIQKLNIVRVEFVNEYDLKTKWNDKDDENRYKQIIKDAKATLKPVFDHFYAYE